MLRDPDSRCNQIRQLGLATVGTSGHFINKATHTSLFVCVKIISEGDFGSSVKRCLGSGRFGVYYLRTLGHFSVCEKVLKGRLSPKYEIWVDKVTQKFKKIFWSTFSE